MSRLEKLTETFIACGIPPELAAKAAAIQVSNTSTREERELLQEVRSQATAYLWQSLVDLMLRASKYEADLAYAAQGEGGSNEPR